MDHIGQPDDTTNHIRGTGISTHVGSPRSERPAKAIVIAHGIGQQRPFEALDSFAQGLVRRLNDINENGETQIVHRKLPQGEQFDHCIRLQTHDLTLDIYEYYWAPMTAGKASFAQVLGWLRITALTPLQRLAYNIPLILVRSRGVPTFGTHIT
jgi:hypothetical protein